MVHQPVVEPIKHEAKRVPVASGAGYIQCSCGWRSKVEDDGNMYDLPRYSAKADFQSHAVGTGESDGRT